MKKRICPIYPVAYTRKIESRETPFGGKGLTESCWEKLPVSGVRKLFAFLTNGNAEIKFHTIACKPRPRTGGQPPHRLRDAAAFLHILYRLPVLRDWPFHRRLGHDYITQQYLRLPVEDLSSEILEISRRVRWHRKPVAAGTWTGGFFCEAEEHFGVKGFASTRALYDDPLTPLSVILRPDQPGAGDNAIVAGRTAAGRSKRHPQPVYRAATGYCGVPRCGAAPGV